MDTIHGVSVSTGGIFQNRAHYLSGELYFAKAKRVRRFRAIIRFFCLDVNTHSVCAKATRFGKRFGFGRHLVFYGACFRNTQTAPGDFGNVFLRGDSCKLVLLGALSEGSNTYFSPPGSGSTGKWVQRVSGARRGGVGRGEWQGIGARVAIAVSIFAGTAYGLHLRGGVGRAWADRRGTSTLSVWRAPLSRH